jgi:hypothetical protein
MSLIPPTPHTHKTPRRYFEPVETPVKTMDGTPIAQSGSLVSRIAGTAPKAGENCLSILRSRDT